MPLTPVNRFVICDNCPLARFTRKMLVTPFGSERKYRLEPSGDHCGLSCRAGPAPGARVMRPSATSIKPSASDHSRRLSRLLVNRSVAKARVFPSGDQAGWRSANSSLVSRCELRAWRSYTYRSVRPPPTPEKAMERPSGDQLGL